MLASSSVVLNPAIERACREVLARAESFFLENQSVPAVRNTFGYFTRHPVAPLNQKRLALILGCIEAESARLGRKLRIVDFACGGGLISGSAASLGHSVLGLDISHEELKLAERFNADATEPRPRFQQADLLKDPDWERSSEDALGGKPDLVILAYALHHIPDVERFTARLGAWLSKDALLVVNEENPRAPLFRLKHRVRTWIQKDTEVEWHRSHAEWKGLLERSGFSCLERLFAADIFPGLSRLTPAMAWSLVFEARKP